MLRCFLFFIFLLSNSLFSQQVSGTVTDEDKNPIPAVLVVNLKNGQKVYTNLQGEFSILASTNDELRFVRNNFDRNSTIVKALDFSSPLKIVILRSIQEIEEVKVPVVRLTGDLNQDSGNLNKIDRTAQLQTEIGVPAPPEKPRETPSDFKKDVLLPLIGLSLKPQAIYNLISGNSRRMKTQYRYDDLHDHISWIKDKVGETYFVQMAIPKERIVEFLAFSIGVKPEIKRYIKTKNLSGVLLILEETLPLYLDQSNNR